MDEEVIILPNDDLKSKVCSDPIQVTNMDEDRIHSKPDHKFKRCLIGEVRNHRTLYDTTYKAFSNIGAKQSAWSKIAKILQTNITTCKNTWVDLRYDYQCYVRRLRKFGESGNKNGKHRPIMAFETDMIFLWRFIDNRNLCPLPLNNIENVNAENVNAITHVEDDDIVVVEDDPVVVIDLDDENDKEALNGEGFVITRELRRLVDIIKIYQELYNTRHRYFNDFRRRGIIWNAIANELGDKATKLMKIWLHMQTRYEWELNKTLAESRNAGFNQNQKENDTELEKLLDFLKPYILKNPNTVYKQSFYLKLAWHEPIEHFKNIFNLLAVMKKFPQIVTLTDKMVAMDTKDHSYFLLWNDISKIRASSPGQCETTWLILRTFYWELMNMRKQSYQLQDKWYFESIITDLYVAANNHNREKTPELASTAPPSQVSTPSVTATVPLNLDEDRIYSSRIETKHSLNTNVSFSSQKITMPVITSAKSLAPQTSIGRGLQITSIDPTALTPIVSNTPSTSVGSPLIVPMLLPYSLPEHTKVTALTPASNVNTSLNAQIQSKVIVTPAIPTVSAPFSVAPITTAVDMASSSLPSLKVHNSISLLNPNEIMIELIGSPAGNLLVVHGPPLTEKYSLSMGTTAVFIREVMSIPLLHNKNFNEPKQINIFWQYLSKKIKLPTHICKAIWNFLVENFAHFPQIAPMEELMKPLKIVRPFKVWKEKTDLFQNFETNAVKMGWQMYQHHLPLLMEEISKCRCLYLDISRLKKSSTPLSQSEITLVWRAIRLRFPEIPKIPEIWAGFRNVFLTYMNELEVGVNNKWPLQWWRVLAKLKFLMDERYNNMEPFYYIVRNKIIEEIERCNNYHMRTCEKLGTPSYFVLKGLKSKAPVAITVSTSSLVAMTSNIVQGAERTESPVGSFDTNVRELQTGDKIDPYTLILAVRRFPQIYKKSSSSAEKIKSWTQVARELNTTKVACRLAFQRALKNYRVYLARDPASRCRINQKYYKHLGEIYRALKPQRKLNIKTPSELNQSVAELSELSETTFPERFVLDINMDNSSTSLVMKNWAHALGNLTPNAQESLENSLCALFHKYSTYTSA